MNKSHHILKKYLDRKKTENTAYSLRSLARDLNISPGFLSECFNGKKILPLKHLELLIKKLDLDSKDESTLKKQILLEKNPQISELHSPLKDIEYTPINKDHYAVLSKWYYLPILDLTTLENFNPDAKWIAAKIGISLEEVKLALDLLLDWGFLKETAQGLIKDEEKIRFPSSKYHPLISSFHVSMLNKTIDIIKDTSFDDDQYQKRSIHAIVVAANSKNVEKAKKILVDSLYEVAAILNEGPKDCLIHLHSILNQLDNSEKDE